MTEDGRKLSPGLLAGGVMTVVAFGVDNISDHDVRKLFIMALPYGSVLCVPVAAWVIWRCKAAWTGFVQSSAEKVLEERTHHVNHNANLILKDDYATEDAKKEAAFMLNNARMENLRLASKHHQIAVTDISALQANSHANDPEGG